MNIQKLLTRFATAAVLAAITPSVFAGVITFDITNKAFGALANPDYGCCMGFGYRADPVPEPSSLLILALGLLGFGLIERRIKA